MKLKNYEIHTAHKVLRKLMIQPTRGGFKFKLLRLKTALEPIVADIEKAIEGVTEKENLEISKTETEIGDLELIFESELYDFELSAIDLVELKPLMADEKKVEETIQEEEK